MAATGLTAIISVGVVLWGGFTYIGDIEANIAKNADDIEIAGKSIQTIQDQQKLARWAYLNTLRREAGLGLRQYKEWCLLGKKLFEDFNCPPWDRRRPRSD